MKTRLAILGVKIEDKEFLERIATEKGLSISSFLKMEALIPLLKKLKEGAND